jgi:hypothetical protein
LVCSSPQKGSSFDPCFEGKFGARYAAGALRNLPPKNFSPPSHFAAAANADISDL